MQQFFFLCLTEAQIRGMCQEKTSCGEQKGISHTVLIHQTLQDAGQLGIVLPCLDLHCQDVMRPGYSCMHVPRHLSTKDGCH